MGAFACHLSVAAETQSMNGMLRILGLITWAAFEKMQIKCIFFMYHMFFFKNTQNHNSLLGGAE